MNTQRLKDKKLAIQHTKELLDEYEKGELQGMGYDLLMDHFIDLIAHIRADNDGAYEGFRYQEMSMLIQEGDLLPQPFSVRRLESPVTGELYEVEIKLITGLLIDSKGNLVVRFMGRKSLPGANLPSHLQ